MPALRTAPTLEDDGAHERTAGKGKPRHDAPELGRGVDPSRAGSDDRVGPDSGGGGAQPEQGSRALVEHSRVEGELRKLPKPVQRAYGERVASLRAGEPHSSTHSLNGPLRGWQATNLNFQYRMIHRNVADAMHVLSVGNHDESYDQAVRRQAAAGPWSSPRLTPEHRDAFAEPDHARSKRKLLDLAKNPAPGTQIWRGEIRHRNDLDRPPSVGMHWTVNPDQIVSPYPVPEDHHQVMWQATIHDPAAQTIPRSHPIWGGIHRSMDSEAEVRLKPGAQVHLNGAYVRDGGYRPMDHTTTVEHRPTSDGIDYSDFHLGSLSDEDRVSVAEEAMERGGHTGRTWHVPSMHQDDPARHEAQRPVHDFVNGVLSQYGHGPVKVSPKHWDLRNPGSGRVVYDHVYGTIGLKGEDTNDLELLHEMAHAVTGKPGHDKEFVQTAHGLYRDHLGPEAAETFRSIVEPSHREAAMHPYTKQDWYHAGHLNHGSLQGFLHVGTKESALQRIDPDKWDLDEFPEVRHARLHRMRLSPGARVCPQIHEDDEDAGSLGFRGHGDYDVHPYRNAYEDRGSISLVGRAGAFQSVEDLGRHPKWGQHREAARRCSCGLPIEWDESDGWQHADGSISHDGEFYGKSVSDLVGTTPPRTASLYTVRLEHSTRDDSGKITPEGPVSPPHLKQTNVSHVRIEVPAYDEHGRPRDMDEMDNEARSTAVHMTTAPGDMVTKADIIHMEASRLARFTPTLRVFTHTCGLDHRLWDADQKLKPDVRRYVLHSITTMWAARYFNWSHWARIYFAGSEASEWSSENLEGNNDFDVLVGVDYDKFRQENSIFADESNQVITDEMNAGFRQYNGPVMLTIDGTTYGPFDRTTYVNPDSHDIRKIKPYAAYDVGADKWVVKPPHLPHWSIEDMPKPLVRALRAADAYAHSILKLPEPERTQQGAALFEAWHADRSRAFSERGEGWFDIANLREKWLDQEGVWAELVDCAHRAKHGLDRANEGWSNTPTGYVAAKLPKSQKCKYCTKQATQRVIHSEGMAYIPACGDHLGKAKDDAARCTPDGSVDPSNIDAVRKIASMQAKDYEGEVGNRDHITRGETGDLPIDAVRHLHGNKGERPGEHRNRQGQDWEDFKSDIAANGIREPIFITVDHGQEPKISEGSHRRDAAVELGLPHIPAEVRYFGHAERQGTVEDRARQSRTASSRGDALWGAGDVDALFNGHSTSSSPFTPAGRSKLRKDYDPELVAQALVHPKHHQLQEVDPRELRSTQPSVTRAGVQHYMTDEYRRTGRTFADQNNIGNQRPVIYHREDGQKLILAGHHRGASALLKGQPLQAVVIQGPWGPPRRG